MEILFFNKNVYSPKVSIILLDWSCRESFHILRYLANQTIPRDEYEIIWIEYYDRRVQEIEVGIKESERVGKPPPVDQWIIMDMPCNVYFHKHLMYNISIVVGRGKIITVCDSDAMVTPSFVESIIKSFEEDRNIVLHMDEFRNNDRRFYPFNYPSVEEVIGYGCINCMAGKTTGLLDTIDPLHTRNYGACMSALREDLINIGGADEHIDYLGHICGPYEMTFRLVNAGKKEVWHEDEFFYHVWHPGQAGFGNYLGPHDGEHMSTTALRVRKTKRILPLVENTAIRMLRLRQDEFNSELIIYQAIPEEMENWTVERLEKYDKSLRKTFWEPLRMLKIFMRKPEVILRIVITLLKVLIKQLSKSQRSFKNIWLEVYRTYLFLTNINKYNAYVMERCKNCLKELTTNDIREIALYGAGEVAGMLYYLAPNSSVQIKAVYDCLGGKKYFGFDVMPVEAIKNYNGKIVVATLIEVEKELELLKGMGVREEQIIVL